MRLKLVDNAVDSIKITMDLFNEYTECDDEYENRYLKMTIIFLHNSIELLLKALLIQEDETLIYDVKNQDIINTARAEVALNSNLTLDEYLIKYLDIHTISYSTLVDKYVEYFPCNNKTYEILKILGNYRNAITHFGIDKNEDVDKVFNVIYETFAFIVYDLSNKIVNVHEYFEYNDMIDTLEPWYEAGLTVQQELCCKNSNRKIKQFTNMLKNVINSIKFKSYIQEKNIIINDKYTNYDNNYISYEFFNNEYNLFVELITDYKPYYNFTFFNEVEGYILFVVDHYNETIYLPNKGIVDDKFYCDERKLIEEEVKKGNCIKKPLTENNIRNIIIEKLRLELNNLGIYNNVF